MRFAAALFVLAIAAPARAEKCAPTGDAIFEIDALVDKSAQQKITKLFDSGAWTVASTGADGKAAATSAGCLANDKLATIKNDLKQMTWQAKHNRIHCMAVSPNYNGYKIG